jgi:adenylate cyclase
MVGGAAMLVGIDTIAGATSFRLVQYGFIGASLGLSVSLVGVHGFVEAAVRPARVALARDTAIGDGLPRSRPTFAAWPNMAVFAIAFAVATAAHLGRQSWTRPVRSPCSVS